MAIAVRGTPAWSADRSAPSIPAGTAVGDVAVLLSLIGKSQVSQSAWWTNRPSSWRFAASRNWADYTGELDAYYMIVGSNFASQVVAPTLSVSSSYASIRQMLIVFTGSSGVDDVLTGFGMVPTLPGGGAFVAGIESLTGYGLSLLAESPGGTVKSGWKSHTGSAGTLTGADKHGDLFAIELLPSLAPLAPTVTTPAAGAQVAAGSSLLVEWVHRAQRAGGSQRAYRLRVRQDAGAWRWWDGSDLDATSAVSVTSGSTSASIPAALVTGSTVDLIVETQEEMDGQWSPASATRSVQVVSPPSVTVTGPTGTLTNDMTPTVTLTVTPGSGLAHIETRVVITDAGGAVVWDSGTRGPVLSVTAPATTPWVRGATYTATVTVAQTGGASATATSSWVMTWTEPAVPTSVTATPGVEGVEVVVDADPNRTIAIERVVDGVPTLLGWVLTDSTYGTVTVTDVMGPDGEVTYRARAGSDLDGVTLWSAWVSSAAVTRTDRGCYLAAANSPLETWQRVGVREDLSRTIARGVQSYYPIGADRAIVLSGPTKGQRGSTTFWTETLAELDGLLGLLQSAETLLLRLPAGPVIPVSVASEVEVSRLVQTPAEFRHASVAWVERPPVTPTGTSSAPVTHPVVLS